MVPQIAALGRLHNAGILHRDIRPANLILLQNERDLADFDSTFIDFECSLLNGKHPTYPPDALCGDLVYAADRVLDSPFGEYL